jgi:hypothetical protein
LGLPRPIDPENFFGAQSLFFSRNAMPIPTGCLAHFDEAVYRPYLERLVAFLGRLELGWSGPVQLEDPPRYCLLRDGVPTEIPEDLRAEMPEPPRVSLSALFGHFDRHHGSVVPMQLLDLLTLVSEDIGPVKFAAVAARRPWVAEFMR